MNTQDMFNMSCSDSVQEYRYVPVTQPKLGATFMLRHIVTDFDILHAKKKLFMDWSIKYLKNAAL